MIEAELEARVRDPAALRDRLRRLAGEEISVYRDTYYDRPGRDLTAQGRELRVRVMETSGVRRAVLTYKEPAADAASGSKFGVLVKVEQEVSVGPAPLPGVRVGVQGPADEQEGRMLTDWSGSDQSGASEVAVLAR